MSFRPLLLAAALLASVPAAAQPIHPDVGRADPALAPYGREAYRALEQACLPNSRGALPFRRENAPALAAADVRLVDPPQWVLDGARDLQGGTRRFAARPSSDGRIWLASLEAGAVCRVIAIDGPPRGRTFVSADAALRDPSQPGGGWRLRRRVADSLEFTERVYEHLRPEPAKGGRSPDAVLNLEEFVYGGGPTRRLRLLLTVQSYK